MKLNLQVTELTCVLAEISLLVLLFMFALIAGQAIGRSEKTAVVTLNELNRPGQLVQMEAKEGACRYYGHLDDQGHIVLIERKVCRDVDHQKTESPYRAKANVGPLPVSIGTQLELI